MKLLSYAVPVLILLLSFFYNTNPFIVKEEARQAYRYLDQARYRWNDSLMKEAENKALDMAHKQQNNSILKNENTVEFRFAGAVSGQEAIQQLLTSKDIPNFKTLADIGIGYAKCDIGKKTSYTCIVIVKQQ
jgi:hypothetical protein